jgi:hypothetical protein
MVILKPFLFVGSRSQLEARLVQLAKGKMCLNGCEDICTHTLVAINSVTL